MDINKVSALSNSLAIAEILPSFVLRFVLYCSGRCVPYKCVIVTSYDARVTFL